jgi:hypothetical protein
MKKLARVDEVCDYKYILWVVLRILLMLSSQLPYHQVLLDFPFKGDEVPLRNMEHAELITIGTVNGAASGFVIFETRPDTFNAGRPSVIKPGRPVYKHVFERLVEGTSMGKCNGSTFSRLVRRCYVLRYPRIIVEQPAYSLSRIDNPGV